MNMLRTVSILLLAAVAGSVAAQSKDWYTVVGGATFDLSTEGATSLGVRVPLAAAPGASVPAGSKLVAQTVDVSNKLGRATKLRDAFKVELAAGTDKEGPSLVVKVEPIADLPVGPYGLVVRVAAVPEAKTAPVQQSISLTLNVPTPELRVQPFAVDIERAFPVVGTQAVTAAPLQMKELTGRASVRDLKLDTLRESVPTKPDSGRLSFAPQPTVVQPGEAASAAVSASGIFPLGKTAGKLEVRSKDLQAPVSVAYEVRVIESKAWIPVLAFLGAFLGYLLRTVLKRHVEYKAALANASEFIASIERARSSSLDEDYRKELQTIRDALDQATRVKKTAAVVVAAIDAAKPKLEGARTKLDNALANLLPKVQEVRSLVDVAWRTPGRIDEPLGKLRGEVFLLEQELLARNAKAATERLNKAVPEGLAGVVNAAGKYGTDLTQYSDTLAKAKLPVSDSTQKQLADTTASVMKTFPGAWSDVARATVAEATTYLNAIYGDATVCRATVESLPREALAFVDWSGKQLQLQAGSPALSDLAKATQDCLDFETIGTELDAGATALADLGRRVSALREAWVTFSQRVAPTATADEVKAQIEAGSWRGLVELIGKKQPKAGAGSALGAGVALAVAGRGEPPSTSIVLAHSVPVRSSSTVRVGTGGLDGSEGEVYRLNERSELYAAAQTALFAFMFVFGVVAFYDEAWVGTCKEMLALFILAFSVDLTADGVVGALKR